MGSWRSAGVHLGNEKGLKGTGILDSQVVRNFTRSFPMWGLLSLPVSPEFPAFPSCLKTMKGLS